MCASERERRDGGVLSGVSFWSVEGSFGHQEGAFPRIVLSATLCRLREIRRMLPGGDVIATRRLPIRRKLSEEKARSERKSEKYAEKRQNLARL